MSVHDAAFMRRALELAARGSGMVQPNPLVGAVIVRDGVAIGEGYHEMYGGPHAEVNALRAAGAAARGAALYVTLEPCAHHGRTPPCAQALIDAGITQVIVAALDPHEKARGGAERLRAAGIEVDTGLMERAARRLNAPFFHWHERATPWVTLKLAISADAQLAVAPGVRTTITGPAAQAEVHRMRAQHDAILVGSGTALADDPLLTVRGVSVIRPPVRVIIDTEARLPLTSRLVRTAGDAPVWVMCASDAPPQRVSALEAAGVRMFQLPRTPQGLDLRRAIAALGEAGVRSIFVEGGAEIAASLHSAALVDRLHLFGAPLRIGPAGLAAPLAPDSLFDEAHARAHETFAALPGTSLVMTAREMFGADVLVTFERAEQA